MVAAAQNPNSNSPAVARIVRWLDLMRTTDKLLLAGLQRKVGPQGDQQAAYRQWYADQMREHEDAMRRVVAGLAATKEPL